MRDKNTKKTGLKYIYGPVASWRLGRSLGIDLITRKKACTFDCIYCQIGKARPVGPRRKIFIPTKNILDEVKSLPAVRCDYITLSGVGEPTLAGNLGQVAKGIKKSRKEPLAILTNATLLGEKGVIEALRCFDIVIAKLDAGTPETFEKINRPARGITLARVLKGIKKFRKAYRGTLALQCMFVKQNIAEAGKIAGLARKIRPDQVQINTPTRPGGAKALSRKQVQKIKKYFKGLPVITVYDKKRKKASPIDKKATRKRRPGRGG